MTRFIVYRHARYCSNPSSGVFIRAFADRVTATASATELMRVAVRRANPFAVFGRHFEYDGEFVARLLPLGIPFAVPPEPDWPDARWQDWYEAEAPHLSEADRVKVWSLFDARPLYGVVEVPLEE